MKTAAEVIAEIESANQPPPSVENVTRLARNAPHAARLLREAAELLRRAEYALGPLKPGDDPEEPPVDISTIDCEIRAWLDENRVSCKS